MSPTKHSVAIIGLGGTLGQPLIRAFTSETFRDLYAKPIKGLTRDPSKYESTDEVEYLKGDLSDPESLKQSLEGVDILVDATSIKANKIPLVDAAKAAGVKLYVIPGMATDVINQLDLHPWHALYEDKVKEREYVYKHMKSLSIMGGVFSELNFSMPEYSKVYPKRELILRSEYSDQRFTCTSIEDVAKSVPAIVHRPLDEIPAVVKISGDTMNFDDLIDYFRNAYSDVKFAIQHVPWSETVKQADESDKWFRDRAGDTKELSFGDESGSNNEMLLHMGNVVYANFINPDNRAYVLFEPNDNEWVNPNNKYFSWKSWDLK
ncbi:hypothetical protein TRICI_006238 [Trichomonascus ciferrii]|uniref:NmrA-like domain-containing protein n=1 Tax=Trichomonascus ciferrii TaxID=44093 RepID=A0A642UJM3_9ASCO|nr:hypothetical protein TRICI_006238 [Trichomonascus ciferrii]